MDIDPNLPRKVATDRYRKRIREEDANRADSNYAKSAAVGALAGLAARFKKSSPSHRAMIGAGAGLLAEGITRALGSGTSDYYGERNRAAKKSEKIPIYAGLGVAGHLAYRRIRDLPKKVRGFARGEIVSTRGKKPICFLSEGSDDIGFAMSPRLRGKLITAAALAGGITAADAATSAAFPLEGERRRDAAKEGIKRGLVYGGALAASEPVLHSLVKRGIRSGQFTRKAAARSLAPGAPAFNASSNALAGNILQKFIRRKPRINMGKFQQLLEARFRATNFRSLDRPPIKSKRANDAEDLASQRRKLLVYGGGALLGAAGLGILARRSSGPAGAAVATKAAAGRGTMARNIQAKSLVSERGYIHMRPMMPGESKRFDKLPAPTKAKVGKFAQLAVNPNLSAGERQKFRQAIGRLRSVHRFAAKGPSTKHQSPKSGQLALPIEFSSFIKDIAFKDLPAAVRKDVRSFHPDIKDTTMLAHYGIVAKELAGKADPHNLAMARKNVGKLSKKSCADEVYARRGKKFVLLNNDQIVDGHHFLAKAEHGRFTGSLHALDLTPSRFQKNGKQAAKNLNRKLRAALYFMEGPPPQNDLPPWVANRRKNAKRRERLKTAEQIAGIGGGAAALASLAERVIARRRHLGPRIGAASLMQSRLRLTNFRRQQLREESSDRWADPRLVAIGEQSAYYHGPGNQRIRVHDLPVAHAQVLRKVYRDAGNIRRTGGRIHSLLRDTTDVAAGNPRRTDAYGRPQRREWEKPWFHRAATDAAIGAATVGGLIVLKKNPALRGHVMSGAREIKRKVNKVVPDFFAGRKLPANVTALASRFRINHPVEFDVMAGLAGWDVRDPRGRSARVFAPGAQRRLRREKFWHEKVDNQRKLLGALALAGTVAAGTGGLLVGRRFPRAGAGSIPLPRKVIEGPWKGLRG